MRRHPQTQMHKQLRTHTYTHKRTRTDNRTIIHLGKEAEKKSSCFIRSSVFGSRVRVLWYACRLQCCLGRRHHSLRAEMTTSGHNFVIRSYVSFIHVNTVILFIRTRITNVSYSHTWFWSHTSAYSRNTVDVTLNSTESQRNQELGPFCRQ